MYSYGKPSAFIVEDPTQFSSHGKSRVAPLVFPIARRERAQSRAQSGIFTLMSAATEATENPDNAYQISEPNSRPLLRRCSSFQSSVITSTSTRGHSILLRPSSPEFALRARFIHLLRPRVQDPSPFVIDGLWAESIPARIGSSHVFDLAVEFAINSYAFYRHATFSNRKAAIVSRGKALKALRIELQKMLSFDVLLTIKMHFHSEVCTRSYRWISS